MSINKKSPAYARDSICDAGRKVNSSNLCAADLDKITDFIDTFRAEIELVNDSFERHNLQAEIGLFMDLGAKEDTAILVSRNFPKEIGYADFLLNPLLEKLSYVLFMSAVNLKYCTNTHQNKPVID